MTDSLITRLVVGEPKTVSLGRPVGQKLGTSSSAALRWKAGSWVRADTPRLPDLSRLFSRGKPQSIVVPTTNRPRANRRLYFAVAGATALLVATATFLLLPLTNKQSASHDLPIAPAVPLQVPGQVRVVGTPYVPPTEAAAFPSEGMEQPPLPIAKPPLEAAAAPLPFAPSPTRAPERKETESPAQNVAKPTATQKPAAGAQTEQALANPAQKHVSAVVLDEAATRPPRAPVQAAPIAPGVGGKPAAATTPPGTAPAAPTVKPSTGRGTGLIAITPDSKVAVFSNLTTKLPQQFKIGDKLPGGDTIRSIDAKDGKVVTSTKEYSLD